MRAAAIRQMNRIRVGEQDPFAADEAQSRRDGIVLACPSRAERVGIDNLNTSNRLRDLFCAVGGMVVDDDNFETEATLITERIEARAQARLLLGRE